GNHATTTGNLLWVKGVIGKGIKLNGTKNFASVISNPSLTITEEITISMWIKPEKKGLQYLVHKTGPDKTGFELTLDPSGKVTFQLNHNSTKTTSRFKHPID